MTRRLFALLLCLVLVFPAAAMAGDTIVYPAEDATLPTLPDDGILEAHFIPVGTADSFLLRCGPETILIDCGRTEATEPVLAYLEAAGVEHLDYAFITHPHNDHLGGLEALLDEMPVGTVILPGGFEGFSSLKYDALLAKIDDLGLPTLIAEDGLQLPLGKAALSFYQWDEPAEKINDRSIILHAALGNRAILFSADVENKGQAALAELHGDALRADILKMPHHGLAVFTDAFYEAVQPELSVFTNAKHRIMERNLKILKRNEIDLLITTVDSALAITDGGESWEIWTVPFQSYR